MKRLSIILYIVLLCAGCVKQATFEPQKEGPQGITITLGLNELGLADPEAGTRASEDQIATSEIHSCAICLFKLDETNPSNSRIVAYRIFVDPATDDQKYFFKNTDNFPGSDGITPLSDILISDAGGDYADGTDDTTPASSPYGLNGIATDKLSVTASFLFGNPMHGPLENLRDGEYHLITLANFHEEPIIAIHRSLGYWIKEQIRYWQTNQSNPGFNGIVFDPIIEGGNLVFGGSSQVLNARVRLYDARIESLAAGGDPNDPSRIYISSYDDVIKSNSYIHNSSTSLCASASIPIKVKSGSNNYSLALSRLASRASFSIHNQGTMPIVISEFKLSDNFASAATYLFPTEQRAHNSPTWMGSPKTTSSKAIVPYNPSVSYAAGSSTTFFDALLASGYDATGSNPLNFTITVGIDNGNFSNQDRISSILEYPDFVFELAKPEWAVGEGREFCIQTIRRNHFLHIVSDHNNLSSAGGSSLASEIVAVNEKINQATPDLSYIWIIEKASANSVYIKSKSKGQYLKALNNTDGGGELTFVTSKEEAHEFRVGQYLNNSGMKNGEPASVAFATTLGGKEVYINENTSSHNLITCAKWRDDGAHFYLYPVQTVSVFEISKTVNIPLRAYDSHTGAATPIHELKRNEHLNVTVNVNYNQFTQDLDFSVDSWDEINNEIDFH